MATVAVTVAEGSAVAAAVVVITFTARVETLLLPRLNKSSGLLVMLHVFYAMRKGIIKITAL